MPFRNLPYRGAGRCEHAQRGQVSISTPSGKGGPLEQAHRPLPTAATWNSALPILQDKLETSFSVWAKCPCVTQEGTTTA